MNEQLGAMGSGISPEMQQRIDRGLDDEYMELVKARHAFTPDESLKTQLLKEFDREEFDHRIPHEIYRALFPTPEERAADLEDDIENQTSLRAEILATVPLLTTDEILERLGLHKSAMLKDILLQMEADNALLSLHDHGDRLYPAWQFTPGGNVYAAVAEVNRIFRKSTGWGKMVWWRRHNPTLEGIPSQMLPLRSQALFVKAAHRSLE